MTRPGLYLLHENTLRVPNIVPCYFSRHCLLPVTFAILRATFYSTAIAQDVGDYIEFLEMLSGE